MSTELSVLGENWLLNVTLVAEIVQPSSSYNLRVDSTRGLKLGSYHSIELRFAHRYVASAGRTLVTQQGHKPAPYRLSARIMPMPSSPDHHTPGAPSPLTPIKGLPRSEDYSNDNLPLSQTQPETLYSQDVSPAMIDLAA